MAKILIVDDALVMRKTLSIMLTQLGHTVVAEASNGIQACVEYEKHHPDLVTMDINMPGINGIEAIERLLQQFPQAKIIVISALGQKHMVFEAVEKGAQNYIVKPITAEKLASVLQEVLHK